MKTYNTHQEAKIEPKDGEWWMCNRGGVEVVFLRKDDDWRGDENDSYSFNDAVPLYKMVKEGSKALEEPKQVEWDGEGLPPVGVECEFKEEGPSFLSTFRDWTKCTVLAYNKAQKPSDELQIIIRDERGEAALIYSCDEPLFRKPETPEQKEERERLEAAYDLYCDWCLNMDYPKFSFEQFKATVNDRNTFLSIVEKTNYRKQ